MAASSNTSHAQTLARKRNQELQALLTQLPPCVVPYFNAMTDTKTELTRLGYAQDLRIFFDYVIEQIPAFHGVALSEIPPERLRDISGEDIERYFVSITAYERNAQQRSNAVAGKSRKLSAVRTLLQYWFEHGVLDGNVATMVRHPKARDHVILRLDVDEAANLLDLAETGTELTRRQQAFHQRTAVRDLAILTLFLGTGIRVSELVGINLNDLDFRNGCVRVTRKGQKQELVYFAGEVEKALLGWQELRAKANPLPGHEQAFFLSIQRKRISVRAVENLVEKYAQIVSPLKHISPHKLRSTFATNLYRETGDIYLVAEVLGHRDVNTTRRHYAAMDEERKRQAAKAVHLREEANQ